MTKQMNQIAINHEKTKETEQYSDAKIRILPKPSPKNIRKKELFNICKNEVSKTSVLYIIE